MKIELSKFARSEAAKHIFLALKEEQGKIFADRQAALDKEWENIICQLTDELGIDKKVYDLSGVIKFTEPYRFKFPASPEERTKFVKGMELPAKEVFEEWLKKQDDEKTFPPGSVKECLLCLFMSSLYTNSSGVGLDVFYFDDDNFCIEMNRFYQYANNEAMYHKDKGETANGIMTMKRAKQLFLSSVNNA
jgi:hypothetical protein